MRICNVVGIIAVIVCLGCGDRASRQNDIEVRQSAAFGCLIPGQCDDHNPCTNDLCGPGNSCVHNNKAGFCNDNNACTSGETCRLGVCLGPQTVVCPSNQVCQTTTGTCEFPSCGPPSPIFGDGVLLSITSTNLSQPCADVASILVGGHYQVLNGQLNGQPVVVSSTMRVGNTCNFIFMGRVNVLFTASSSSGQVACTVQYEVRVTTG